MTNLSVTITGADDDVDPNQLAHLSKFYPFVEWGILFSEKRRGTSRNPTPRYPSLDWIQKLEDLVETRPYVKLAMHLCGREARIATASASEFNPGEAWRRVQLNGYEAGSAKRDWSPSHGGKFSWNPPGRSFFWILQARSVESLKAVIEDGCVSQSNVLYDPSGGEGRDPSSWPEMPTEDTIIRERMHFGFAGGIGPENIEAVLREIFEKNPKLGRVWIDMESGVRKKTPGFDVFDLDRVKTVLDVVAGARRKIREKRST